MKTPNQLHFDGTHHEFALSGKADPAAIANDLTRPLSIIVQVTRRCPLKCSFCSESDHFPDPSFRSLLELRTKLSGIQRVYLSGGEPLVRPDIFKLLKSYKDVFPVVGLPTNCILITKEVSARLTGVVSYVNAGLDGPRNINDGIRGHYDEIIAGLCNLRDSGIEVSLSSVILKSTLPYLDYVVQTADALGVIKVKMVIPVFRGRAKRLTPKDFAKPKEVLAKFDQIVELKAKLGWRPRVKFTFWNKETQGYALLVYPDRRVYAWPVLDAQDGAVCVGDLNTDSIEAIWNRYPYKENHVNKYVGLSMHKA